MILTEKRPVLLGAFCLLVAYLTLFHQLGTLPFFGSDEPRYAQIGKEMFQSGDLVTPTLEGRPWLEKPPLLFWMLVGSFTSLGFSEWSARLPNAILALIVAAGAGVLGGRYRGVRCGLLTFLILNTSLLFVGYARAASTDLPLTAAFTLSMLAGFRALNRSSCLWALLCGAALGLTVLAKGFVAAPLVLGCLFLYVVAARKPFVVGPALVAAASIILVAAPWFWLVWTVNGQNFVITFFINQHLARIATDLHHHSQPFWYYFPVLLGGFFPWILFLPASARDLWIKREKIPSREVELELLLWIWTALPLLFFSVSTGKLAGYILPVFPAISLLVAIQWDRTIENNELTNWMAKGLSLFPALALVLVFGAIIGFSLVFREPWVGVQLAAVPLGAVFVSRWAIARRNLSAVILTLIGFTTLGLALIHTQGAPIVGRFQSTKELCEEALPHISPQDPLIFFRFHHYTAYYYAHGKIKSSPLHTPAALLQYVTDKPQNSYIILTETHGWSELKQLQETELLRRAGNFYLVKLENTAALAHQLEILDREFRSTLKPQR